MRHHRCYLEMGKLEEAETEISNITNDINSHLLRIQLNIKRNHLPDAVAMIKQIPKMDGIKAAHLFSLLDTNSELLKLHALRAALIVEPKNRFIFRSLFATIAMATELTPSTKIEFTLTFINDCDNDDIARRTTQEMGQLALKHGMYSEAETLFQICLSKISEENVEEYLKVSFSKSQSVYENNNHIYSEMDLPELEKLTQLCGNETRILFRKKFFCIHIRKNSNYHGYSWLKP